MNPAPQRFTVTFFANHGAANKREERLTIGQLAQRIRGTTAPTKEQLPWLKLARFGDQRTPAGSLRHNANVIAISGIECDYDGKQMPFEQAEQLLRNARLSGLIYTSPSFTEEAPKWRVLCPLSVECPPSARDLLMARLNGLFGGIFSHESWKLSQSYYFGSVRQNPSHRAEVIAGDPIDLADHLDATAIRPALREAKAALQEARATRASDDRPREADDASLIEKIRARLDLSQLLAAHGYARRGNVWRHPNSQSGGFGADIKTFSGIERVYSHNGGDPLHPGNLPAWTAGVTAIDVVDVAAILDFGGDRTRALRELAERFHLTDAAPPFRRVWKAAALVRGTVAATWLETIGLAHLADCPELRFHRACPHPSGARLPALVAAVRDANGALTGVHRTYLRPDGFGLADIAPQQAALGRVQGGAVRLASLADVLAAGAVVVATDLEEAASLGRLLRPELPAWAAATAANLAAGIALPAEIRRVVIAAVGTDGAPRSAWFRFRREGRAVQTATPGNGAARFNDTLKKKLGEATA
jgi:hypothetical protein